MSPLARRRRSSGGRTSSPDAQGQRSAYGAIPYPGDAFPQTHPRHVLAEARLFGLRSEPVESCRVLELGCGDGGNLLPMAEGLPDAELVGVDLSGPAIAAGTALAREAGLNNLRLVEADLTELDPTELGTFDVVIAHGVYSWVPEPVRDRLLEVARACLAPHGVAFVSFNLLPGSHLRLLLRDVLRREIATTREPHERLAAARALLQTLEPLDAYEGRLRREVRRLLAAPDHLLFHDELAEVNDPVRLGTFAAHAKRHGLRWLTDARLADTVFGRHADAISRALTSDDDPRLAREERLDDLTLRVFRQALLCRDERRVHERPDARAIGDLLVASPLRARSKGKRGGGRVFVHPDGGELETDHPQIASALDALEAAWPQALRGDALVTGEAVARALLSAHAGRLAELVAQAPETTTASVERPTVSALNRLRAARGEHVTTAWHEPVALDGERALRLVRLLDGSRDRTRLQAEVGGGPKLDDALRRLAGHRLLVPQPVLTDPAGAQMA